MRLTVLNGDNQMAAGVLPETFTVRVSDGNGVALVNAPVTFSAADGAEGLVRVPGSTEWSPSVQVRTVLRGGTEAVAAVEMKAPAPGKNAVYKSECNIQAVQVIGRAAGLAMEWNLDELIADTDSPVADAAGFQREGRRAYGVLAVQGVDDGKAVSFSAANQTIRSEAPPEDVLPTNGLPFTISFWIHPTADGTIFSNRDPENSGFRIWYESGNLCVQSESAGGNLGVIRAALPGGVWSHVVLSTGNGTAQIYVDGALAGSGAGTILNRRGPLVAGGGFSGMLDRIRVHRGIQLGAEAAAGPEANRLPAPVLTPAGGSYSVSLGVRPTCAEQGARIHYTVNGSQPSASAPSVPAGGIIPVVRSLRLHAVARKVGWAQSVGVQAEFELQLDPTRDTDGDGISDAQEGQDGTRSDQADSDGDGISDLEEKARGTDPMKVDTDGDGVNDREDAYPLDPLRAGDFPEKQYVAVDLGKRIQMGLPAGCIAREVVDQALDNRGNICYLIRVENISSSAEERYVVRYNYKTDACACSIVENNMWCVNARGEVAGIGYGHQPRPPQPDPLWYVPIHTVPKINGSTYLGDRVPIPPQSGVGLQAGAYGFAVETWITDFTNQGYACGRMQTCLGCFTEVVIPPSFPGSPPQSYLLLDKNIHYSGVDSPNLSFVARGAMVQSWDDIPDETWRDESYEEENRRRLEAKRPGKTIVGISDQGMILWSPDWVRLPRGTNAPGVESMWMNPLEISPWNEENQDPWPKRNLCILGDGTVFGVSRYSIAEGPEEVGFYSQTGLMHGYIRKTPAAELEPLTKYLPEPLKYQFRPGWHPYKVRTTGLNRELLLRGSEYRGQRDASNKPIWTEDLFLLDFADGAKRGIWRVKLSTNTPNGDLQYDVKNVRAINSDHCILVKGQVNSASETSAIRALFLLPVEIEKLWSDQLPGVEANFLPYVTPNNPSSGLGTGLRDTTYIFMGAAQSNNFDGKGHLKAKVKVPADPALRDKILWRLAKKSGGSYAPQNGTSTYDANGEIVTITIDSPTGGTDTADHCHIVAGYDQDGNGQLSASEASVVPKFKWKGEDRDYEVKLVSISAYNNSLQNIRDRASGVNAIFLPQASRLLTAFANQTVPTGATSAPTTIDRLEPGLDHPVGILFNAAQSSAAPSSIPQAGPGASITADFALGTSMANDVFHSNTLSSWVEEQLANLGPDIRNDLDQRGQLTGTYTVTLTTKKTVNGVQKEMGLEIDKVADPDLFLAFGNVSLSVTVEFTVNRSGLVENATFTNGVLDDLFDFYYDGPDGNFVKPAARVQAGYNTLGIGGRVYRSKVHFAGQMNEGPFQIW